MEFGTMTRHLSQTSFGNNTDHSDFCLVEAELVETDLTQRTDPTSSASETGGGRLRVPNTLYANAEPVRPGHNWKRYGAMMVLLVALLVVSISLALVKKKNDMNSDATSPFLPNSTSSTIPLTEETAAIPYLSPIRPGWAPDGAQESPPLALSPDGRILAVASIFADQATASEQTGTVRVYKKHTRSDGIYWEPLGRPITTGRTEDDAFAFTGLALSADGTRVAIGAHKDNALVGNTTQSIRYQAGRIRVFDLLPTTATTTIDYYDWVEQPTNMVGLQTDDQYGKEVVLSHDGSIIAGSSFKSSERGDSNTGNVMVFRQVGTLEWQPMGQTLVGEYAHERFGRSLALSANGRRIAVSAIQAKSTGPGMVLIFDYNELAEEWTQVGHTIRGDNLPDVFGRDVALSEDGSILACGANQANVSGVEDLGMVRAYRLKENTWVQLGQDILGIHAGDRIGTSISLSGDGSRIAVGASQKETGVGYAQLLDYDSMEDMWKPVAVTVGQEQGLVQGYDGWTKVGSELALSSNGRQLIAGGVGGISERDTLQLSFKSLISLRGQT